jgi:hypothetical protein
LRTAPLQPVRRRLTDARDGLAGPFHRSGSASKNGHAAALNSVWAFARRAQASSPAPAPSAGGQHPDEEIVPLARNTKEFRRTRTILRDTRAEGRT